jgi:hypothetical protein
MHAALNDGVFDAKEFGDFGLHGHIPFCIRRRHLQRLIIRHL